LRLTFIAVREDVPDTTWQDLFARLWPAYRRWWLADGEAARPDYSECHEALVRHMPELLPVYERMTELAGGDEQAARFLSMYSPPAYPVGCSQAVWPGAEPMLVRNYDYDPRAFDALILRTGWLGRKVLGLSDGMIGLLDGINEDGLAVSLTFGGRAVVGKGFGIPIVLRYVLETCASVDEATAVLARIPCHMAYNVTVLDAAGTFRSVYLSPDRPTMVTDAAVATNHQPAADTPANHPGVPTSVEREAFLLQRLASQPDTAERFVAAFLRPPLYSLRFRQGFGTLYTAAYRPRAARLDLHWPGMRWSHSVDRFEEGARSIDYQL
jgi:predicted choloylglycine hydrolase